MHRTGLYAAVAACIALALAGCGGGGSSSIPATNATPTPGATATPTTAPLPSPAAATNTQSVALSTSASTTATLPVTGGITPSITIPQASSGSASLTVTVATGSLATMARTHRTPLLERMAMAGGPYVLQFDFVPTQTVTLTGAPGFSLDLTKYVTAAGFSVSQAAAYLQGQGVYVGVVDDAGNFAVAGPITIAATGSALTASYTGPSTSITLVASEHYTIGVHVGPIAAPTSSPTPSPTPTVTPTATPIATPTATPTPTPTPAVAPSVSLFEVGQMYGGGADAYGITADAHGNMWFVENPSNLNNGAGVLSSISGAGVITQFPYYTQTSYGRPNPTGLAFGADGNFWATEGCGGIADVFSASGSYTRSYFYNGSSSSNLCGSTYVDQIIAGTDGNLWFVEGTTKVGKITTSGVTTEYTLPQAGFSVGVTNGPNDGMWFAEQLNGGPGVGSYGGVLANVTSTGQVVTYPLKSGETPGGVTTGADGNLWFTYYNYQNSRPGIGKMTTSGVETDYDAPAGSNWGGASLGIVAGPDGRIWSGGPNVLVAIDPSSGAATTYSIAGSNGCAQPAPVQLVSVPMTNSIWFTSTACIGEVILH
ncbi:MAG TPA: hypothetical protein VFN49_03575 [Candidatus Aquilonibacter sp.]|nr:hypothetical protein [Candidatus Aquilonibacter sp.]